jgi:glycerol-3-phosphate acyltransferase PlsY
VTATILLMIVFGFALGSLPISVWIGRLGLGKEIRSYGDGNPGAFNVLRAGGFAWGGLAIFLDVFKGALPAGISAHILRLEGWPLVLAAVAPIFGHAFSPFLKFKGGKAIATSGGVWIGLTLGTVGIVGIIMLIYWVMALTSSGWAVMLTMLSALLYLLLTGAPTTLLAVWLINTALLAYKHRVELRKPLRLRLSPLFKPLFAHVEFPKP